MTSRRKKWLFGLLALVLLYAVCYPLHGPFAAYEWRRDVADRAAAADRVLIKVDPRVYPTTRPVIEVRDPQAVAEVRALLKRLKSFFILAHCRCIGELTLQFQKGDEELVAITLHHGKSLRVADENWARNPNVPLEAQAAADLAAWLTRQGYVEPQSQPASSTTQPASSAAAPG